jgi:hypothetical protein
LNVTEILRFSKTFCRKNSRVGEICQLIRKEVGDGGPPRHRAIVAVAFVNLDTPDLNARPDCVLVQVFI